MIQGLFDLPTRLSKIDETGDPLARLNELIDWEMFRPLLEPVRQKERLSNAGAKGYDLVLMFKVLILQSLYNLSDEQIEYQVLDRLSFTRFLGLSIGDKVPDATTVWRFREALAEAKLTEGLFGQFDGFLRQHGFQARKGQIVDASIIETPRQRNTPEENKNIKRGEAVDGWSDKKRRHKDVDARWTKKGGETFFGYKNHVNVDVKHKFIRRYRVTDAAVHDSCLFEELLDTANTRRTVWADSAYRSEEKLTMLSERGFREHLQRKGCRRRRLTERETRGNRTRARTRSRVEHVFGVMAQRAGTLILRTVGMVRATVKLGLRNLAYNLDRFAMLAAEVR
jgi:transposase, IS5 family